MGKHPVEFARHIPGDGKRFHISDYWDSDGKKLEVHGFESEHTEHICFCWTLEMAEMIAESLEEIAQMCDDYKFRRDAAHG